MTPDVVVIGGGPAGLSSAIALAQGGASVLVCESAATPGNKPCGEGLLPHAFQSLCELGLSETELVRAGKVLLGVRYVSAAGARASSHFAEGPGLGLRRTALQRLLLRLAERTAGISVRQCNARLQLVGTGPCRVLAGREVITPHLVIGADGLASRARKAAGLVASRPSPFRFGVRQHFALEPWSDHVEVFWSAGVEAYVTPTAEDEVNVAFLWQAGAVDLRGGPGLVTHLLSRFPELWQRLRHATTTSAARASGPLHVRVPMPARAGFLLFGDAAGYLDPLTGEGIGLAVGKAHLLARLVLPVLRRTARQLTLHELKPFLRAARQHDLRHVRLTRCLLALRRSPGLTERVIRALARDPQLFSHFLSANQGRVSPFAIPWASSLGLLHDVFRASPTLEHRQ